jgi:hypothetical protein
MPWISCIVLRLLLVKQESVLSGDILAHALRACTVAESANLTFFVVGKYAIVSVYRLPRLFSSLLAMHCSARSVLPADAPPSVLPADYLME